MISNVVIFWTILTFLIPSLICSFLVLYHMLFDKALRCALHNHAFAVLLVICMIDEMTYYPWMLYYYSKNSIWPRSDMFCVISAFLQWSLYIAHILIFAWAMIERHILIFHRRWLSTRMKRFLIHYVPLISLILYCFTFYFVVYFFPPCQNRLRPYFIACIFPCSYDNYVFSMFDYFAHQIVPIIIITLCSTGLIIRVLWQKYRMRRMIHWRKHQKMIIQALSVAFLYLIILLPFAVIYIILNIYGVASPLLIELYMYTAFFSQFVVLLYPFVCALSLPEWQSKVKNILKLLCRTNRINPRR